MAVRDTNPTPRRSRPWASLREGAVYTIAILAPLVVLALVAALGGESSRRVGELPGGGYIQWIYPRSAIREVLAYVAMACWLLRELLRRTPDEFRRMLWRAPMTIAIINFLLPAPFVLVHGVVRELFTEQAGLLALRFLIRIVVGYSYVILLEWIQGQLRQDDALGLETAT